MTGFVVWFTGLSGAGKSTLGAMLAAELRHRGVHVETLDGDEVRTHLSKGLGFSREDRDTNVRRIGFVAKLIARSGACAITAAISPYRSIREEQRAQIGRFVEVYAKCSVPLLAERDPKGLYKKALAGEIKHFTGVDDPYEEPESPEVVVDTGVETKEESLAKILAKLEELGYVAAHGRSRRTRGLVAPHGGELIDRYVHGEAREALAERAKSLPVIDLDERAERDLELIASGAFSPLKGFMGSKDYLRVVREMRLENGLVWPMPIALAVPESKAEPIAIGAQAALRARDGRLIAVIDVADRWIPDPLMRLEAVFDGDRGVRPSISPLDFRGGVHIGGEVHVLDRPHVPPFPELHRDPREIRAHLAENGYTRVVGYDAPEAMLRGHEYVARTALEICDALLLHPSLKQEETFPWELRLRSFDAVLRTYFPPERVLLAVYPDTQRHGGLREVILAALARKNYGCSHFILDEGQRDAFEAAFAPNEIGIEPLWFVTPFWSQTIGGIASPKTAPDQPLPEFTTAEIMRPEVARLLIRPVKS